MNNLFSWVDAHGLAVRSRVHIVSYTRQHTEKFSKALAFSKGLDFKHLFHYKVIEQHR